ncbi:acyl-CoA dehydrogenase family protein [Mycobacterium vicinigordonae]|uniref:Acyl-CoA/acyl-ACP dehydrogenase n=1 Tax=Mycobacterium vicinigordonae TaxID=1719132 RepID=A0A7D6I3X9_9MYCO|nr:acyl-CoA dehydrogenase family protein [Mycobacterium vicinigordonae]QLL05256.1 acyl-CoA/acyl-ACP dehydrogenase [Mycobacterium vicinigordonae]
MDFRYSTEQDDFRASLRGLLREDTPQPADWANGHDPKLWKRLSTEMELPGLHVPAEFGGAGATLVETAIAFDELGRSLAPVPFATHIFAIAAVLRAGDSEQRKDLLAGLLGGELIAAFAACGPNAATSATVRADHSGRHSVLTGECAPVLHGHVANVFVVPAADRGTVRLYVVAADASGIVAERLPSFDTTRPVARLRLNRVRAELLAASSITGLERVLDTARVLLAAEMLGGAEACLERTVEYACSRRQFGRAIGSFQAIKHLCADMMIEVDATRAAVMFAAMSAADDDDLSVAAPLAKAQAAETFVRCVESAIQIHGGIAFTWEHNLHRYFRRAKTSEALFGSTAANRALLADRAGL